MKQLLTLALLLAVISLGCVSQHKSQDRSVSVEIILEEVQVPSYIQLPEPLGEFPMLEQVNSEIPSEYDENLGHQFSQFNDESSDYIWASESHFRIMGDMLLEDNRLYSISLASELTCIDIETGREIFYFDGGTIYGSTPVIWNDSLLFQTGEGHLVELNKFTGEEIRRVLLQDDSRKDGYDFFLSTPVVHQGRLYVGVGKHSFYCMDPESLEVIWAVEGVYRMHTKPQIIDGRIYMADMGGNVVVLDLETGQPVWNVKISSSIMGNVTVQGDRVFVGSRNRRVHALDRETGEELWNRYYGSGWIMATLPADDDALYVCGSDGYIIEALNPVDGSAIWTHYVPYNVAGTPQLIGDYLLVNAGDVYNTQGNGAAMLFHRSTGEPIFRFSGPSSFATPLVKDGILYMGNDLGQVMAVDLGEYLN